jgi:Protein of unknown function VcgC/VcgE (DUF2780)
MSRIACTLLLAAALPVIACSKATETAGAGAGAADLATPAGLTSMLTSKLGISETQASQALGAILGQAQSKLSPTDYAKLSGAIPGADSYLSAATEAGIGSVAAAAPTTTDSTAPMPVANSDSIAAGAPDVAAPGADVAAAGADAAAAAGESVGMSALNSAFSKIGIPPEAASQFVPVLTDYVGKVGGPEAASLLKGLF